MLKEVLRFSPSRHMLTAALLVVLGACNPAETRSLGYVEVFPTRSSEDAACDVVVPGHLQLDGVVGGNVALVSGDELRTGRVVRRELPAGLYSVSWQPNADSDLDADEGGERWALHGPTVVSIFPGQVTRLRVREIPPERELASLLQ